MSMVVDFDKIRDSLAAHDGAILPSQLPSVVIDTRALISYAKERGVQPFELSNAEKNMFVVL